MSAPFSIDEISHALFTMHGHDHMNASPDPDGFGPSFDKQFWPSLKDDVCWGI
jgi:hypothetical protein